MTISTDMSVKSEETGKDTFDASSSNGLSQAAMPIYLCSSPPELRGIKLFRYKLRWALTDSIPRPLRSIINSRLHFIKTGPRVRLQEALTMDFIARNTTIPIPRILDVFSYQGDIYIVQERIHGPILEYVWRNLSAEKQHSCIMQIKDCLDQLRALKPPNPGRVEAIDGSGLIDRSFGAGDVWGPFSDHDEFHQFLNHDFYRQQSAKYPELQEPLAKISGKKYKTMFSHGNIGPHNMIWRDGRIVVINWETAGWFPEYWEYARAHAARGDYDVWWDKFEKIVKRYDDEVDVQSKIAFYLD